MKLVRKVFAPKEVKAALSALDEAACRFDGEGMFNGDAFQIVRNIVEKALLANPGDFVHLIHKSGRMPREWVYSQIANVAGNHLETGQYHIYRGWLDPMGPGTALLKMFDASLDELVQMKAIDAEYAIQQKKVLRDNIQNVG